MQTSKRFWVYLGITLLVIVGLTLVTYFFFPKIWGDVVYPIKYEDLIVKYSKHYDVDPTLIAAIIYCESRFNPNATSHAGARGLMQVMPATGRAIASRIGESFGDLYDPDTSIRYGTYYIKAQLDKYGGDVDAALAAYNGGAGAADRYVISRSDASIPRETAGYIKKVNSAWKNYEFLYGNILNATNVAEAMKIKQEEEQKTWWDKIVESVGFRK
jgi:soluble lytic murein transglycosylase